jgi:hypothetical protein
MFLGYSLQEHTKIFILGNTQLFKSAVAGDRARRALKISKGRWGGGAKGVLMILDYHDPPSRSRFACTGFRETKRRALRDEWGEECRLHMICGHPRAPKPPTES